MYVCIYACMFVLDLKRCMTDLFSLFYLHKTSNDVNTMIMKLLLGLLVVFLLTKYAQLRE